MNNLKSTILTFILLTKKGIILEEEKKAKDAYVNYLAEKLTVIKENDLENVNLLL